MDLEIKNITELHEAVKNRLNCRLKNENSLLINVESFCIEVSKNIGMYKARFVNTCIGGKKIKRSKSFIIEYNAVDLIKNLVSLISNAELIDVFNTASNIKKKKALIKVKVSRGKKSFVGYIPKEEADKLKGYAFVSERSAKVTGNKIKVRGSNNKKVRSAIYQKQISAKIRNIKY